MRYVRHNGHVGVDAVGHHLGPAQANFLLHSVHDIQTERQFLLIFVQPAGHFGNHEAAHPVVEGPPNIKFIVQYRELVLKRNYGTHVDAHFLYLFGAAGATIQKHGFDGGGLVLLRLAHVDGRPAEYRLHNTLAAVNIYALARGHQRVGAAVAAQIQITFLGNVINKIRYLVGVSLYYNLVFRVGINNAYHRAIGVDKVAVNIWFDVVQPQFLAFFLEASGRGIVEICLEKIEGFGTHGYVNCEFCTECMEGRKF